MTTEPDRTRPTKPVVGAHRVLMLVHDFPPAASAGAWRPAKFAQHLPAFGWTPLVVTARADTYARTDPGSSVELQPPARLTRTRTLLARRTAHRSTGALHDGPRPRGPVAALGRALRSTLFVPDAQVAWWPFALTAALRLARRTPVDVVFATGPPFSTLILGARLARLLHRPFVADFRDPWTYDMALVRPWEPARRIRREHRQEQAVLAAADAVVVTAESLRGELCSVHRSLDPTRVHVVTNGYDEEAFAGLERPDGDRFTLVYTGRLGGEWYDPRPLLDVMDRWIAENPEITGTVELEIAGHTDTSLPLDGRPCRDMVRSRPAVGRRAALERQLGADVLVLLVTERRPRRVPGKLFEYLYAGAPILAIAEEGSDVARILREAHAGETFAPSDTGGALRFLQTAYAAWRGGRAPHASLDTGQRRPEVLAYDRRRLTGRLAAIFDGLAARNVATQPARRDGDASTSS